MVCVLKEERCQHQHPGRPFGVLVSLRRPSKPPRVSTLPLTSAGQLTGGEESTAAPDVGWTNPRPSARPWCLFYTAEKCYNVSSFLGCGLFSGYRASNSRREPSRPQGWAAGGRAWQSGAVSHTGARRLGSEGKRERETALQGGVENVL